MNKKKILKLTAATMAITTVSILNQGRIVKAVENNVQLSENESDLEKSNFEIETQTFTGSAVIYVKDFEDQGNGYLKKTVSVKTSDNSEGLTKVQAVVEFNNADIEADSIILGLAGSNTDYKGSIYIDNIKLSQAAQEDPYVEKTADPVEQGLVSVDSLEMPSEVKLVDNEATQATADLYAYLKAIGKTDKVIYGYQNDTHHKALYKQGTNSDTKDVTGSIAGIIGMDTLSFTGDEL